MSVYNLKFYKCRMSLFRIQLWFLICGHWSSGLHYYISILGAPVASRAHLNEIEFIIFN